METVVILRNLMRAFDKNIGALEKTELERDKVIAYYVLVLPSNGAVCRKTRI